MKNNQQQHTKIYICIHRCQQSCMYGYINNKNTVKLTEILAGSQKFMNFLKL